MKLKGISFYTQKKCLCLNSGSASLKRSVLDLAVVVFPGCVTDFNVSKLRNGRVGGATEGGMRYPVEGGGRGFIDVKAD